MSMGTAGRPLAAPGHMGVDYEERVDFDRLRRYRIARAKEVVYRCERLERRCSDKTLAPEHLKKDVEALRQAMLYLDRQLASHAGWSNHAE